MVILVHPARSTHCLTLIMPPTNITTAYNSALDTSRAPNSGLSDDNNASITLNVIFGILTAVLALASIAIAYFQLEHMRTISTARAGQTPSDIENGGSQLDNLSIGARNQPEGFPTPSPRPHTTEAYASENPVPPTQARVTGSLEFNEGQI